MAGYYAGVKKDMLSPQGAKYICYSIMPGQVDIGYMLSLLGCNEGLLSLRVQTFF